MTYGHYAANNWRIFPLLVCVLSQLACLDWDDEGDHLGGMLNRAAVEMVANHERQRTLIYHPRRGAFQRCSVQLGKHYPCRSKPRNAPFGEYQGGVLVTVQKGRTGTGYFSNYISVPRPISFDGYNADAKIRLVNKGWYVEVTDVS